MGAPPVRRRRRLAILVCAAVLAVPVGVVGWLGVQAWQVKTELDAAMPLARELVTAAGDRDATAAARALEDLRGHAARARTLTDSPLWSLAEVVPVLGANAGAVRTVATGLDAVASVGLAPVLDVAGSLDSLDLIGIGRAREPLAAAASALRDARDDVAAIDASSLLPPVAEGVDALGSALDTAAPVVDSLARVAAVAPGLLGADGPRTILVMLQNNAELRTGGGITGAFVELRAEGGHVELTRQADSSQFPVRTSPVAPVAAATDALYGDVAGRFVQNATMPADFTVSARLASAWWHDAFGVAPDAVIAIDPLVLRALLQVVGPVALADGTTIGADDVVDRLLVDPYRDLDADAQTVFLQGVTSAVFSALSEQIDPVAWTGALAPVVAEGRVSVWSADTAAQRVLASSAVGGPRVRQDAAGPDAFAVYLNDATGGKMGGYLAVSIEAGTCAGADLVRVSLTNTVAAGEVGALPLSVTGGGLWGTAVGDIGTNVTVVAPDDAAFGGATGVSGPEPSADVVDDGRPSTAVRINVSPGETETVTLRFVRPEGAGQPVVVHTPLTTSLATSEIGGACDG